MSTSPTDRSHPARAGTPGGSAGGSRPAGRDLVPTKEDLAGLRVLVVDDDSALLETCATLLKMEGYQVSAFRKGDDARHWLRSAPFDLSLIDLYMTGVSGTELLEEALKANPDHLALIMTGDPSLESSLASHDLGCFNYLAKPFTATQLKIAMGQAANQVLVVQALKLRQEANPALQPVDDMGILGVSAAIRETLALAERLARTDASVFIHGESGTGKELIAHFVHRHSRRSHKPMLAVNCAALPEALLESEMFGHRKGAFTGATHARQGLIEAADTGTLFLDEITEMALPIQAKLLRVIQDGQVRRVGSDKVDATVDLRFIAATNRSPEEAVEAGALRKDLYYRLRVLPIRVPALRERAEDIPVLAESFLNRYWARHRAADGAIPCLTQGALEDLQGRPWVGNIRELQNVIEHLVVVADAGADITENDLPSPNEGVGGEQEWLAGAASRFGQMSYHDARQALNDEFEQKYVRRIVRQAGGNMSEAARLAQVDRTTLYRLMEKHDLLIHREVKGQNDTPTALPLE